VISLQASSTCGGFGGKWSFDHEFCGTWSGHTIRHHCFDAAHAASLVKQAAVVEDLDPRHQSSVRRTGFKALNLFRLKYSSLRMVAYLAMISSKPAENQRSLN
jgi:hypothetical protein